jgi:hypothetical protein
MTKNIENQLMVSLKECTQELEISKNRIEEMNSKSAGKSRRN